MVKDNQQKQKTKETKKKTVEGGGMGVSSYRDQGRTGATTPAAPATRGWGLELLGASRPTAGGFEDLRIAC